MSKFNVGDKLRCINGGNYVTKGEIVTVKQVDEPDCILDLLVDTNNINGGYWVSSKDFELYESQETEKGSNKNVGKFKVGDIVIGNNGANYYSVTKKGFKGKVQKVWFTSDGKEYIQIYDVADTHSGPFEVRAERFDLVSRCCHLEGSTESSICPALMIKQVIFNEPATIVIWSDDVKTVVKCGDDEKFDPEKGLAMCVAKRAWGNKYNYFIPFKKYCSKYQPKKIEKPVVEEKPVEKKPTAKKPVAKNRVIKKTTTKKTMRKTK